MYFINMEKWLLKNDKDGNAEMFIMYCIISAECPCFSVQEEILQSIIKCTNALKFNCKCESLLKN